MGISENLAVNKTPTSAPVTAVGAQSKKLLVFFIALSVFIILGAAAASTIILILSDGASTILWHYRPSVILSVLAPVISLSFSYLLATAISITWWRAAGEGASIEHLHRIWDRGFWLHGSSWTKRAFAGHRFWSLVLASAIVPTTTFLSNPLFQLSTKTVPVLYRTNAVPMQLDILQTIPEGLAAIGKNMSGYARLDFTAASTQWYRNTTMYTNNSLGYKCPGTCRGVVYAPGISVRCSNVTTTFDMSIENRTEEAILFQADSNITLTSDNFLQLTLNSSYTVGATEDCIATLVTETCQIEIARTPYNILIMNNTIRVLPRRWSEWNSQDLQRISVASQSTPVRNSSSMRQGPLMALPYMYAYFRSSTTLDAGESTTSSAGTLSEIFFVYDLYKDVKCAFDRRWTSPTEYMLNAMGEVLFRLALNGNSVTKVTGFNPQSAVSPSPQAFQAELIHNITIYKSNYLWLAVAWALLVLALIILSTMLMGALRLKRDVSLSPVETVQVFSPEFTDSVRLLAESGADLRAQDIINGLGHTEVKKRESITSTK
ncbi:hypothetical protein GQ44DRAFT_782722 [Phaeosphaeriaceae sp. PMI808]|nr:hypothetical protein GQ44DRAFT_782722 [Phaeosphaeriaceae sp. PMI808]